MPNHEVFWQLLESTLKVRDLSRFRREILYISQKFTSHRQSLRNDSYFSRNKNGYLAYFLPLNYLKSNLILDRYQPKLGNCWVDFGCGPGTATLAALSSLKGKREKIKIHLVDSDPSALEVARTLVSDFAYMLQIPVEIKTAQKLEVGIKFSAFFATNVLNELQETESLEKTLTQADSNSVAFFLEPSHRVASQKLIRFRKRLLDSKKLKVIGPCLHQETCPLYRTKHWCHFSEPLRDKTLLNLNRKVFQNHRSWLKFSYLLIKREKPETFEKTNRFLLIGDLHQKGKNHMAVDLCVPNKKEELLLPASFARRFPKVKEVRRGSVVELDSSKKIQTIKAIS
ncbi:MAG: small ribosomal subunit Rsm22 family protein [Bacteriovoracia bacterium]